MIDEIAAMGISNSHPHPLGATTVRCRGPGRAVRRHMGGRIRLAVRPECEHSRAAVTADREAGLPIHLVVPGGQG